MNGLKLILFGMSLILVAGFILVDPYSSFGGIVEAILLVMGIAFGVRGLKKDD